jgi:hypothetical protein
MQRLAVKKILTFLILTLLFSSMFYRLIIRAGIQQSGIIVLGLMWCPGTAALVTRLLYQRNLRDIFDRISTHPASRLAELLPDQWRAARRVACTF